MSQSCFFVWFIIINTGSTNIEIKKIFIKILTMHVKYHIQSIFWSKNQNLSIVDQ